MYISPSCVKSNLMNSFFVGKTIKWTTLATIELYSEDHEEGALTLLDISYRSINDDLFDLSIRIISKMKGTP
jgi:hypothetical protein